MRKLFEAISRWRNATRNVLQPTVVEYWVFSPSDDLPDDRQLYELAIARGISPSEGLVFSDIRFSVGTVLRSKNPHAFRPDLFTDHAEPTPEVLAALGRSQSFVRVRFLSTETVATDAYLTLLPEAAACMMELTSSQVVYDVVAQRLWSREAFQEHVRAVRDSAAANHLRVEWTPNERGGVAETFGLAKVGLPELRTLDCRADYRVLALSVTQQVAEVFWTERKSAERLTVRCFGDDFDVQVIQQRRSPWLMRILRLEGG